MSIISIYFDKKCNYSNNDAFVNSASKVIKSLSYDLGSSGIGLYEGGQSYLETAYYSASIISDINKYDPSMDKYREGIIQYTLEHYVQGSGFADYANGKPLVFATYYGLCILKMLDALNITVIESCKNFLKSAVSEKKLLPSYDDFPSDINNIFWFYYSNKIIDSNTNNLDGEIVEFLLSCRKNNGSFSAYAIHDAVGDLQSTVRSMMLLKQIDKEIFDEHIDLYIDYLNSCRSGSSLDFSEGPGVSASIGDTIFGILGLYLIDENAYITDSELKKLRNENNLWGTFMKSIILCLGNTRIK